MEYLGSQAIQAAAAVLLIEEILKLKIVPIAIANRYPVPVNILLSIVATIVIIKPVWDMDNWADLLLQIGTVAVVAAISYNMLLKNWAELKAIED